MVFVSHQRALPVNRMWASCVPWVLWKSRCNDGWRWRETMPRFHLWITIPKKSSKSDHWNRMNDFFNWLDRWFSCLIVHVRSGLQTRDGHIADSMCAQRRSAMSMDWTFEKLPGLHWPSISSAESNISLMNLSIGAFGSESRAPPLRSMRGRIPIVQYSGRA